MEMPRPETKSDRIQFRLPLPVANELAGDATANGISMGVQAERIIIAHYTTRRPAPTANPRTL